MVKLHQGVDDLIQCAGEKEATLLETSGISFCEILCQFV